MKNQTMDNEQQISILTFYCFLSHLIKSFIIDNLIINR